MPPIVYTPKGKIRAQFPELKRMFVVMSSDMIATAKMKERLDATGFKNGVCLSDSRTVLNYWSNNPDSRIVFGKPLGQFAFASKIGNFYEKPCPAAAGVTVEMRSFYPELADVPIVSSWTGPLDRGIKGLPKFGYLGGIKILSMV